MTLMSIPELSWAHSLGSPSEIVNTFKNLNDEQWYAVLQKSISEAVIDGIQFPGYPDLETQRLIHGSDSTRTSLQEAFAFYKFIKSKTYNKAAPPFGRLLDFGSGWGRIHRPFLKDYAVDQIYAYEPNFAFCALSRRLNPLINTINGGFSPDGALPGGIFGLVVAWSIFSHLSLASMIDWLREVARVLRPGGRCVMTTWGRRFLERLAREKSLLDNGGEIHWYSKVCIDACGGDVVAQLKKFENGEFVWFTSGTSTLYGEAFLGKGALEAIIAQNHIEMRIENYDDASLAQDVFVLERK